MPEIALRPTVVPVVQSRGDGTMKQVERYETVIVGGGQAGLSVGYHLKREGRSFVILDASDRIGDSWRARWDIPFPSPDRATRLAEPTTSA